MKAVKRRIVLYLVNHVFCGTKWFECKRTLLNSIGYQIGEGTKIVGPIECTTALQIGSNCWIGKNFLCNGNGSVVIGDNCDIGPEVIFQTGGHEIGLMTRRAGKGVKFHQSVGSGTWIGGRVTIVGETTIGLSCVIAACSCVTKDVDDNTLVGGIPARMIRKLEDD